MEEYILLICAACLFIILIRSILSDSMNPIDEENKKVRRIKDPLEDYPVWSEEECIQKILNKDISAGAAEYILQTHYGKTCKKEG